MNDISKTELTNITLLVDGYLRRPGSAAEIEAGSHLDEDTLNAFVEGSLSETEAAPLVSHLVECGLCRRFTVELVRLAIEMGEFDQRELAAPPEPSNIRQFLAELAARIGLTADDEAVFAYHAPAEDFKPKENSKPDQTDPSDTDPCADK